MSEQPSLRERATEAPLREWHGAKPVSAPLQHFDLLPSPEQEQSGE